MLLVLTVLFVLINSHAVTGTYSHIVISQTAVCMYAVTMTVY